MKNIFLIFVCLFSLLGCHQNKAEILIQNGGTKIVKGGYIEIYEKKIDLKMLNPSESTSIIFDIQRDDSFKIQIDYLDGPSIKKEGNYITPGFNFKFKVIILNDQLLIEGPGVVK